MNEKNAAGIFLGTSNIVLPVKNKTQLPEAFQNKSRLTYYASLFNTVELNSTFKKLPMLRTVEKWAEEVPAHFQFTFKFSSIITHNKGLTFNPDDIKQFFLVAEAVKQKRGCLLLQFPGKLDIAESGKLEQLLQTVRQSDPEEKWKVAIEFRNVSWYTEDVYALLKRYAMAMVFHDMPGAVPPLHVTTASFVYLRFHGTEKGYRGSYPDDILHTYAKQINTWNKAGRPVYAYFNNTLGDAAKNLITLKDFLDELG